jgi:hypothetical protein
VGLPIRNVVGVPIVVVEMHEDPIAARALEDAASRRSRKRGCTGFDDGIPRPNTEPPETSMVAT